MEQEQNKPRSWRKIITVAIVATVTPGGFIVLGVYGIKKLFDRRKSQNVSSKRPEKRNVSDS